MRFGDTSTSPIAVSVPTIMPSTMPPVLQRFQNSVSSTQGKLADDATAKASATRWATFWPFDRMPIVIAMAPTITVAIRAARTCSCCDTWSLRITPTYRSCAIAEAAASTSPATTATIVANATAATNARNRLPSIESGPPPTYCASSGPAMLPPASIALMFTAPTCIAEPMPRNSVST